ncbi:MAG: YbaB/EbfC family nucleoid-associated protein [Fastidiosipilaceae bacterium]|jgi:DNA-binding YbaB/EbfC family protein
MAKGRRGGFQGGGKGGPNMNQLLKQAQKMQEEMQKAQEAIDTMEVESTAGGGMVRIKVNGEHQVTEIEIKPEAVDPDDIEMLQDLIMAGVNDAMRKMDEESAKHMGSVTGGMGGLGGPGMPF